MYKWVRVVGAKPIERLAAPLLLMAPFPTARRFRFGQSIDAARLHWASRDSHVVSEPLTLLAGVRTVHCFCGPVQTRSEREIGE
jgi:hypothetical protein